MALNRKSGRGWRQGWLGSGQALGRCFSRPLVLHGRPLGVFRSSQYPKPATGP